MRKTEIGKDNHKKGSVSVYLLAMIFSVFMTAGRSFAGSNEWNILTILNSKSLCLVMVLQLAGWFFASYFLILFLFDFLKKYDFFSADNDIPLLSAKMLQGYWRFLDKRPVTTIFITLITVNVPNAILSYPVKFMGDNLTQFFQFDAVPLYTHHPVFHTLLLKMFYRIGEYIANMNVAFCLYGITQALFVLFIISFVWGGYF